MEVKISIPVTQSSMPDFDDYIEEIKELWENRWLTNMGVKHDQLEKKLAQYLNAKHICLFTNGHLALEYIIKALELTGEVITTPFTFVSTTHAIIRNGLTPVFADINPEDYTIQTDQLEQLITEKTSAIVPVHVYGNVCNVVEIERIAKKYNLKVIYDAAHAFGVTVDNVNIANFGDASMFSFHATKVFNTIEGGAVTFSDYTLKAILDAYKNFGMTDPETVKFVGGNAKMNEFQAAMGLCNLRNLDQEFNKRRIVFERYIEKLSNIDAIKLPYIQKGVKSNYSYFPVIFESGVIRDTIYEILKLNNIFARKYFYPLTNRFEYFGIQYKSGETPVAQDIAERVLTLPLYADLEIDSVDRLATIIKEEIGVI